MQGTLNGYPDSFYSSQHSIPIYPEQCFLELCFHRIYFSHLDIISRFQLFFPGFSRFSKVGGVLVFVYVTLRKGAPAVLQVSVLFWYFTE